MLAKTPKLGIIAGGGTAPRHIIEACRKTGRTFFVICLEGQADKNLGEGVPHAWLHLGAWTQLKSIVKEQQLEEAVLIGHVRRPSIRDLKPDLLGMKVLAKIGLNMLGDDALLRSVGKAIEEEIGLRVIGAQDVFADLLTPDGQLGRVAPDDIARTDIALGINAALKHGAKDKGQAVVVQQGTVLDLEAIDGTNALIERCVTMRLQGPGGVLVKMAKPQQDNRFDLPAIGPDTIAALAKAGLRGVAIEARHSLLLEREETIAQADKAGIFIIGLVAADYSHA